MLELVSEMWAIFAEEWGRSCLIFAIPTGVAWVFHNGLSAMSDLGFIVAAIGKESLWGAGAMVPYLGVRAHLSLRAQDKLRIQMLEAGASKGNFKIWLEDKMDAGAHYYFFRGHIFNEGGTVEGVQVRLVGLNGARDMNLQWTGGQKAVRDINNEGDEVFDIAKIHRHVPQPLMFIGWEGPSVLYASVDVGEYEFDLHITGKHMKKLVQHFKISYSHRGENSVEILAGDAR